MGTLAPRIVRAFLVGVFLLLAACSGSGGVPADGGGPHGETGPTADLGAPVPGQAGVASIIVDVLDGKRAVLGAWFGVRVEGAGASDSKVRAREVRFEVDGETAVFPMADVALDYAEPEDADDVTHVAYVRSRVIDAPAALVKRCDQLRYAARRIMEPLDLLATVDGQLISARRELNTLQQTMFPPLYPVVLCHRGVDVKRKRDAYLEAMVELRLRPDGLYDAAVWLEYDYTSYDMPPVQSVDPDVTVMPTQTWSGVESFTAQMKALCPGCTAHGLLTHRFIASAPTVPLVQQTTSTGHTVQWCEEPQAGETSSSGETWPPAAASSASWGCGGSGGEGILRFTGQAAGQPVSSEIFVTASFWSYGESDVCKIGPGAC
jgi:hypothetical protein